MTKLCMYIRHPRCPFRKSGTSVMTRSMSCPRRRASSPQGARLLDSRLRGNDAAHQGAAATGRVFMKWTSKLVDINFYISLHFKSNDVVRSKTLQNIFYSLEQSVQRHISRKWYPIILHETP